MVEPLPARFASGIAWANVLSTLVGIPLAWFGLVLLEFVAAFIVYKIHGDFSPDWNFPQRHKHIFDWMMVIATAPWLYPMEGPGFAWLPPLATLILLLPYYFVSVRVEAWIMRKFWSPREKADVLMASRRANAASYTLLAAASLVWLIVTGWHYGRP
jgi:hypothetical protein